MDIKSDEILDRLREVKFIARTKNINEADTRHKVIDFVLHDFLAWPKNRVALESYISPGFADYVLQKTNGDDLLFIEAKKAGRFFELPIAHCETETSCYISIKKLLTDSNVKEAMEQVRAYCMDTGCEYACITNGVTWIFFKTFEKGKRWETLQAFVVRNLNFFSHEYTKAINTLSFTAITERSSLPTLLSSAPPKDRSVYFTKQKIPSYSHPIKPNSLASSLRPIVTKYFGVIADYDTEFMDRCYVSQREYVGTSDGMRALIMDSLSPYFEEFGVRQLEDTGRGGRLGGRLKKNVRDKRQGEVLVLFGGKGSGKSTFLKRLLHHNPPPWLVQHAAIAIVDLLKIPEDLALIRQTIWERLVVSLDTDRLLDEDREMLTSTLFADRFEVAERQDLAGLSKTSETYNLQLNALVAAWKSDLPYCAQRLVAQLSAKDRGAIVVVDNTDQYPKEVQDFCFATAQEISQRLKCVTLISMREERFFDSKIHGVLDAFQNSGFHISSPRPSEVFKRRLDYAVSKLTPIEMEDQDLEPAQAQFLVDAVRFLSILSREFSNEQSPLNRFLTASAHGDIRLSLDLFRSFLLSGYTNVDEMVKAGTWNFLVHQVIRPVMIPTRYFYDETVSDIPNIYQVRSTRNASHFTALRILRRISKGVDPSSPPYFSVATLRAYFAEVFGMIEDFEQNLDVLLKQGFVEANNRIDAYSDSVDSVKITNYGLYMLSELAFHFTYLDLVCTDCGIFDETVSNYLVEAARNEYQQFMKHNRGERINIRLDRVQAFIDYLTQEELRERELYSLGMPIEDMFSSIAKRNFTKEKKRVLRSLKRQQFDA